MTPHQALALGVRLFVVWSALVIVREFIGFLPPWRPPEDSHALAWIISVLVVSVIVLLILWFFPRSIAKGLLPGSGNAPAQSLSYELWFTVGIALIGLWFAASAIAPILRNLSAMYFFRSELINLEDLRSLRLGVLYYLVELILGLCLLFGAPGIKKFVLKVRHVGPD